MNDIQTAQERNGNLPYDQLRAIPKNDIVKMPVEEFDRVIAFVRTLFVNGTISEDAVSDLLSDYITKQNAVLLNPTTNTPVQAAAGEEITNAQWVRAFVSGIVLSGATYNAVPLTHITYASNEHWVKWEFDPLNPIGFYTVTADVATITQGATIDVHNMQPGQVAFLVLERGPTAANATAPVKIVGANYAKGWEVAAVAGAQTLISITRINDTYYATSTPLTDPIKKRYRKPDNFRVTAITATSVSLAWNDVAAPSYRVSMSTASTFKGRGGTLADVSTPSYTKTTGLTPGSTYYFSVYARNGVDYDSEMSKILEVTMPTA